MANQKEIRNRIGSVKNTQKITRAMKMVAGARLTRAQNRIQAMRPYAVETARVLHAVVGVKSAEEQDDDAVEEVPHPFLARREEKRILLLVVTSDRGLCGAFNSSILRKAEATWRQAEAEGKEVKIFVIGRKGRDYFKRRNAPVEHYFQGLWDELGLDQARRVARAVLAPFLKDEVDSIYLVYNEFKSAMTQRVVTEPLFPLSPDAVEGEARDSEAGAAQPDPARPNPAQPDVAESQPDFVFEPDRESLLEVLVPMYIEVTLLRALYESTASELGARMTAMDSATKNASDMIDTLTLQYNRARQAAITTELMEIIGGAEALNA